MKSSYGLGLAVLAVSAFFIGSAGAQVTTANGPYYATPSWDQTLPASTRFIVLSNMNSDAVLDRETGLVWQRAPFATGGVFWRLAGGICIANSIGGRFGWRLPTVQELGSLLDPTATSGPPLPAGHPFIGIPAVAAYWTATTADDPSFALIVHWEISPVTHAFAVYAGDERDKSNTSEGFNTPLRGWCVRGGLQAAPQ